MFNSSIPFATGESNDQLFDPHLVFGFLDDLNTFALSSAVMFSRSTIIVGTGLAGGRVHLSNSIMLRKEDLAPSQFRNDSTY